MGRRQLTLHEHCKGSHFNWGERLMLQYYYTGWNGYRKERSPTVLGKIFQKSPKTISRELRRGMVEHLQDDPPFIRIEYNAEHAQLDAEEKMKYKGPAPKSGKHYKLVDRIAFLILERHYSPYAVVQQLESEGLWPAGLTICEKTLYNWIEAGDIPGVTRENLPRKGKLKQSSGGRAKRKHSRVEFASLQDMGSEELGANLFRITQTEAKLRREQPQGLETASGMHYQVGQTVREAIAKNEGTMPENLPTPEKSISEIGKEQLKKLKEKKEPPMLDE